MMFFSFRKRKSAKYRKFVNFKLKNTRDLFCFNKAGKVLVLEVYCLLRGRRIQNLPQTRFGTDLKQCQTKPEIRSFHEKRNLHFEKKNSKVSVLQLCSFIPVQRTQITHTTQFETDLQHFQTK